MKFTCLYLKTLNLNHQSFLTSGATSVIFKLRLALTEINNSEVKSDVVSSLQT